MSRRAQALLCLKPIADVAKDLGLDARYLIPYGESIAKVRAEAFQPWPPQKGRLVLVTGMTPTPRGEGKTVTSVGMAMALSRLGHRAVACIRQPSLGPVFGVKGGGAGGGAATIEPMQQINMRFTGDIDAMSAAHNLLAAMIDNHIFQGNELQIDPASVTWPRALDMNDRALREITVGLGAKNGVPRQSHFVITAASEIMAIVCLSRDYADLKRRLGRIIVGYDAKNEPVRASDLKCVGAMGALLKEAMLPNLVQTGEGTPALVHGGPFGNIAHGTCSLASMRLGLSLADYLIVEAGFASDLGAEKFVDIVTRAGDLRVDVAVLVVTVKALRYHGGAAHWEAPDAGAVRLGLENVKKHLENVRLYGLTPVVAVNRFPEDSDEELRIVAEACTSEGVPSAVSTVYTDGGSGSEELARLVVEACRRGSSCKPVYGLDLSVEAKIEQLVKKVYGGRGVEYTDGAREDLVRISRLGLSDNPICVAKTAFSFSDEPSRKGRPRDFIVTVRKIEPAAGAGFNIVHMGQIVTMPGLPKHPAAENIDISDDGAITGVF
ncbi:MAG: formate--tetrahydrofolate ligase [Thaumarchaeota archaeon]|nr:formate--tetrahydrofolate ligase [Nitrososphaerota archaeon]